MMTRRTVSGLAMLAVALSLLSAVVGDCYMHNPRGSNNRFNGKATNVRNQNRLFDSQNNAKGGYAWAPNMYFYEGSTLMIEWTAQHGASGGNSYANYVFQYMCDDTAPFIRDGDPSGGDESRQTYDENESDQSETNKFRGRHETASFYNECKLRERNKGLFVADQNLNENRGATATRQNPGGTQYGLECPEERDYWPYWHPSPWKDIAVMTTNLTLCGDYQRESQNVANKGSCSNPRHNNQASCEADQGVWAETGRFGLDPPDCRAAPYSRDNHLGNTPTGYPAHFNWTLPLLAGPVDDDEDSCVLRIRYNITSGEMTHTTDHTSNGAENSPVVNDPLVDVGMGTKLQLALDTTQTGRTFQDRSQTFVLKRTRTNIPIGCNGVYNLNVRGRRGNIVQCFPAVEYDFVPAILEIPVSACLHIQWTGSDLGAGGQAGEGTDRTDRSNMVQLRNNELGVSYPEHIDNTIMWDRAWFGRDWAPFVESMAFLGGTNEVLNDAPAYWDAGVILFGVPGEYNYMSTRNNNFTNRSQRSLFRVGVGLSTGAVIAIAAGGTVVAGAGLVAGAAFYSRKYPGSRVAQVYGNARDKTGAVFKRRGSDDTPKAPAKSAQPTWSVENRA